MEELKGKKLRVQPKGYVQLIDWLGSDVFPAQVARVSYGERRRKREDDKLVNYLYSHGHLSPFEFNEIIFRVKAPIFVARQWFRHRTGNYAELSGRYTEMSEEFWTPDSAEIRGKDVDKSSVSDKIESSVKDSYKTYRELLDAGVAREQARSVLPLGLYTEFYYKSDLRNLFNFLRLRLSPHAQKEIFYYAAAIGAFVKKLFPNIWDNFLRELNQISLTKSEREILHEFFVFGDGNTLEELLVLIENKDDRVSHLLSKLDNAFLNSKSARKEARRKLKLIITGGDTDDYVMAASAVDKFYRDL